MDLTSFIHDRPRRKGGAAGFTILELLTSIALLGLALATIIGPMIFLLKSNYSLGNMTFLSNQSRLAVERIGLDLRSTVDITTATSSGLSILIEDPDGVRETIVYAFDSSSGVLSRTVGTADSVPLVRNLESLNFYYYDSGDSSTTTLIDVKKVEVEMALSLTQVASRNEHEFRSARFVLRNRPAG